MCRRCAQSPCGCDALKFQDPTPFRGQVGFSRPGHVVIDRDGFRIEVPAGEALSLSRLLRDLSRRAVNPKA